MKLSEAIEAHIQSSLFASSFGDPREIVQVGPIRVMRDAPGRKRDPRNEQFVISGVEPAVALQAIRQYGPKKWALSVIEPTNANHARLKEEYKAAGYRLITTLPFFVKDLSDLRSENNRYRVERVVTLEQAETIKKGAGRRLMENSLLTEADARMRMYGMFENRRAIGWVQSTRANDRYCWASWLYVPEKERGKGIGTAVMQKMLEDDAKYGAKFSALLASNAGCGLYRRLGYEEVGIMQIFTPKKR